MNNSVEKDAVSIDLIELGRAWLESWWLIICSGVLIAIFAFVYSKVFITPIYRAEITVYVNNQQNNDQVDSISGSNLSASQQLVQTYIKIINSDMVLEKVIEAGNLDCSVNALSSMITASQIGSTAMFTVYVKNTDPEKAAEIANAVAAIAPSQIEDFIRGSSARIIDYAKVPKAPSSPNKTKNTMMGFVIGIALALIFITLRFLLDVRVKSADDLTAMIQLPVLAEIPDFAQLDNAHSKRGYGGYGYGEKEHRGDE